MAKKIKVPSADIQQFFEIPEAVKLRQIHDEMSTIWARTDIPLTERVRLYEEKLGWFRYLQEKIIKNGSTSYIAEPQKKPQEITSYIAEPQKKPQEKTSYTAEPQKKPQQKKPSISAVIKKWERLDE